VSEAIPEAPPALDPDLSRRAPPSLPWRSTLVVGFLAVAAWGGGRALAARPALAEALVAAGPHPELTRGLTRLAGLAPVALAELLLAGLVVWIALLPWWKAPGVAALRVARMALFLLLGFQLLWGVQYARPGLAERLGLPASGQLEAPELAALAEALVARTNDLYLALHAAPDAGAPTPAPDPLASAPELQDRWEGAARRWSLPSAMARPRPTPRPLLLTPVVRWTGIAGVFVPWTGEGLVLTDLAGPTVPHTVAHESAHQRGVARESDANALAYLLALETPDPRVRYAGALFLQRQALAALSHLDPEATLRLVEERLPGVQRDVEALAARAREVEGPARRVATRANDAMLRGHGVPDGVRSYAGSLWIVAALARERGLIELLP
jgi:hypothetical protein